jgi:hypothetical protein
MDKAKPSYKKEESKRMDKSSADDKMTTLFAHRKANGLCFTYGFTFCNK